MATIIQKKKLIGSGMCGFDGSSILYGLVVGCKSAATLAYDDRISIISFLP